MNIDLFKTEEGREQLAREYVNLLESDETEPVPDSNAWLGEKKFSNLESAALTPRLFREYAEFCEKAQGMASEPTIRALFQINRISGLRRLPESEREDTLIRQLFEETDNLLQSLEDSPRKNRLSSLRHYHAGIFFRVIGDYLSAAESQDRSAELAEAAGDLKSAAISRFTAAFERINHALVNEPGSVKSELAKKVEAVKTLYKTLETESDPTSIRYKLFSGPNQLILTHFWSNEPYDGKLDRDRLGELESADQEFFSSRQDDISAVLAVEAWSRGNTEEAHRLAEGMASGALKFTDPVFLASAHLLLGRVAAAEGKKEEAKQHFKDTIAVQGWTYQIRAVAERELNALNE